MAAHTKVVPPLNEELGVVCGVRIMARSAQLIFKRHMQNCAAVFKSGFIMAHEAQISALLGHAERFGRGRRIMAGIAAASDDRVVCAPLHELRLL